MDGADIDDVTDAGVGGRRKPYGGRRVPMLHLQLQPVPIGERQAHVARAINLAREEAGCTVTSRHTAAISLSAAGRSLRHHVGRGMIDRLGYYIDKIAQKDAERQHNEACNGYRAAGQVRRNLHAPGRGVRSL